MGHMLRVPAENTLGAVEIRSNVWIVAYFMFSIIFFYYLPLSILNLNLSPNP